MKTKWILWAPLVLFFGLSWILLRGLLNENLNQNAPQLNKPAPAFNLPSLQDPTQYYTQDILKNKISVINFWATWCPPCRKEHPVLVEIAKEYPVSIIGVNYKDQSQAAQQWLNDLSNPYSRVLTDENGKTGIDWGVIGVPETFVIDATGIVRYKYTGPITWRRWEHEIWPLIQNLSKEPA